MLDILKKENTLNEILSTSLFLYLGTVYFSFAIPNIFLGVIIATFLLILLYKRDKLHFSRLKGMKYALIIAPFILTIISVLISENATIGSKYLIKRLPILIIPFIVICTKFEDKSLKEGAKYFVLATLIAVLITGYNTIRYFNEDILLKTEFTHFITIIQHPYFGIYVLTAMVFVLELGLINSKYLRISICLLFIAAIILSTSRLVYILFLVYACYYLYKSLTKNWFIGTSSLLGLLIVVFLAVNPRVINKFKSSIDYKNSPRLQLWNNALKVVEVQDAHTFGIGIGDYYENKKDPYYALGYKEEIIVGVNPHSQLIEFYITNGIFGVSILILSMLSLIWIYLRKQNGWAIFIFSMIVLFSLTECIFTRQFGVQLYVILIPLCLKRNFKTLKA